jgi:uncharacterized membrane protein (DUF4010 family)
MDTIVNIDPMVLQILVAFLLPAVVALITNRLAGGHVKALTLLFLNLIAAWLTELQRNDGTFQLWPTVIALCYMFATGVLTHFGLLEPIKVTGTNGVIQKVVPGGIGSSDRSKVM